MRKKGPFSTRDGVVRVGHYYDYKFDDKDPVRVHLVGDRSDQERWRFIIEVIDHPDEDRVSYSLVRGMEAYGLLGDFYDQGSLLPDMPLSGDTSKEIFAHSAWAWSTLRNLDKLIRFPRKWPWS